MELSKEVIVLVCPVTRRRLQQAVRLASCTHATAFDAAAIDSIRVSGASGELECPICGARGRLSDVRIDERLTLFCTANAGAEAAAVRPLACGGWAYRKATRHGQPHARRCVGVTEYVRNGSRSSRNSRSSRRNRSRSSSSSSSRSSSRSRNDVEGQAKESGHRKSRICRTKPKAAPRKRSGDERRALRHERRQRKDRAKAIEATRAELIHRALHEDGSAGEALW